MASAQIRGVIPGTLGLAPTGTESCRLSGTSKKKKLEHELERLQKAVHSSINVCEGYFEENKKEQKEKKSVCPKAYSSDFNDIFAAHTKNIIEEKINGKRGRTKGTGSWVISYIDPYPSVSFAKAFVAHRESGEPGDWALKNLKDISPLKSACFVEAKGEKLSSEDALKSCSKIK